jgi:hypothetical protein
MTTYNYKYLAARRKPIVVHTHDELPDGNWMSVAEAAKAKRYSAMTIRMRFLRGKCEGYRVGIDGKLLVNVDQIF